MIDLEKIKERQAGKRWAEDTRALLDEDIPNLIAEVEALRKDLETQTNLAAHYQKSNETVGDQYMALRAKLERVKHHAFTSLVHSNPRLKFEALEKVCTELETP